MQAEGLSKRHVGSVSQCAGVERSQDSLYMLPRYGPCFECSTPRTCTEATEACQLRAELHLVRHFGEARWLTSPVSCLVGC